jgi:hypothetical protein
MSKGASAGADRAGALRAEPVPVSGKAAHPLRMSDESLAVFLGFTPEEIAAHPNLISGLSPERRALFERMADVVADLNMGVVPDGVIACKPSCRHG